MRYAALSLLMVLTSPLGAEETIPALRLASLEWLPYMGNDLPHEGLSAHTLSRVAALFGHRVQIDYFPWKRAMQLGGNDPGYAGYFPAYFTDERALQCHFSRPMGHSTVGLAQLKTRPVHWEHLVDLAAFKLGIVLGYSNGKDFDAAVEQGRLTVEVSNSDLINLKKLLASRVAAVVIDHAVLRYLLFSDPELMKHAEQIEFQARSLDNLPLYICFQRTAIGEVLKQRFDAALLQLDLNTLESTYFHQWQTQQRAAEGED